LNHRTPLSRQHVLPNCPHAGQLSKQHVSQTQNSQSCRPHGNPILIFPIVGNTPALPEFIRRHKWITMSCHEETRGCR
jgi:hypothetical protein